MTSFLYVIISAMIVENLFFARGLGTSEFLNKSNSYKKILNFGIMSVTTACFSSGLAWICFYFLRDKAASFIVKNITILLCVSFVYLLLIHSIRYTPKIHSKPNDSIIISAAFNSGVLGAVLLSTALKGSFFTTVGYSFGATVGMTIAMLLLHSGRERMEVSSVPKVFEGMPISLIYIGIMSLAIYALIGHQLPT